MLANIPDTQRRPAASVGSLVYLAAVRVVATAIAGVFFTAVFLLLAPPGDATISSSHASAHDPQNRSSGPVSSSPAGRDGGPETASPEPWQSRHPSRPSAEYPRCSPSATCRLLRLASRPQRQLR